jgi:uncharacterized DUF497 family protein
VDTAFEWDAVKAAANLRKHGVSFEVARLVFADPRVILDQDRTVEGEVRWQAIGMVRATTVLAVAHLWRETEDGSAIRIISARRASYRERRAYEDQDG